MDPEIALLIDLHAGLDRLGPGTEALTRAALARCEGLPKHPQIVDMGCGAGAAALALAAACEGTVLAFDRVPAFLDHLRARALARGLSTRVQAEAADMAHPPLSPASVDLVWSEGAVYFLGVERAAQTWGPLLRPGGWLCFTELCWTTDHPPEAARRHWAEQYPSMGRPAQHLTTLERGGWRTLEPVALPAEAWAAYHGPLQARLKGWQARHADDPLAAAVAEATQAEIDLVAAHPGAFGYVCFTAQRPGPSRRCAPA